MITQANGALIYSHFPLSPSKNKNIGETPPPPPPGLVLIGDEGLESRPVTSTFVLSSTPPEKSPSHQFLRTA